MDADNQMPTTPEEREIREEIVSTARSLSFAGLSPGTTGNISAVFGSRIICSPTNSNLAHLIAEDLSVVDREGNYVSGNKPTKETAIHAAMYQAASSVQAVVHLHATYSTALSCLNDLDPEDALPAMTPYLTMRAGAVKLIDYFAPGSPDISLAILAAASQGSRAMLLANHGCLVGGNSLAEASSIAHELEESAKLYFITSGFGVNFLTANQQNEISESSRSRT